MAGKPQTLSEGQRKQITWLLWKQIISVALVFCGLTGVGLWQMWSRLGEKLETLVAKQFEEPRIQSVVSSVAETRAEALLLEQILPEVQKFKADINSQIKDIRAIVAKIETLKSQSDINAKQIEAALSSARRSEQEIDKVQKEIYGLHSNLVKIERGIIEIQYYTYLSRGRFGKNPYQDRIEQKMNELLRIAIPNPQERSKFVEELKAYKPKE